MVDEQRGKGAGEQGSREPKFLVSDIASALAAKILEQALLSGQEIEIPSLGIKFSMPEYGPELPPEQIQYSPEVQQLLARYDQLLQEREMGQWDEEKAGQLTTVVEQLREQLPPPGHMRLYNGYNSRGT